ncbi:MAG: hypothetical protein JHC95_23955, partial [Solirubrobacteraceae bacterium]|nr:hypothetical protein [Solirubrobacteraceae bacterium]
MTASSTQTPIPADYEALHPHGQRTGLGDVVVVRRVADGAELTLTVLDASVSADARFHGYFLAVMERLRLVDHPAIVKVIDVGEVDGRPWVVSQQPAGHTVRQLLAADTLAPRRAVELLMPITRALRTATEFGLQHHDLDAGYVLVTDDDQPLLLEPVFLDPLSVPGARSTRPDLLTYVPPERLQQSPPDDRTDVHALGGLLLTALTGHPPGSAADRVLQDREREGGVPQELDLVLWQALAADPEQRQATPREFVHHAQRALGGEAPERFIRQPQRAVTGAPSSSTQIVRWGTPGNVTSTLRGPESIVTRMTSTVSGWSASAGRAIRGAGGNVGGFFSRLRPGSRPGADKNDRPGPPPSVARPAAELEAPRDDADPHQPRASAAADNGAGAAPAAAVGTAAAAGSDPAARIGAAAERLRQDAPAAKPSADETDPPWFAATPDEDDAAPATEASGWASTDPAVRLAEHDRKRRARLVGTAAVVALVAGTAIVLLTGDDAEPAKPAPAAETTEQGAL